MVIQSHRTLRGSVKMLAIKEDNLTISYLIGYFLTKLKFNSFTKDLVCLFASWHCLPAVSFLNSTGQLFQSYFSSPSNSSASHYTAW